MLLEYVGQDCTEVFYGLHRHEVLQKYGPRLLIGRIDDAPPRNDSNRISGREEISKIKYTEPSAFQGAASPYWTSDHIRMRANVRAWVHEHILPEAEGFDAIGKSPSDELFRKLGASGMLAGRIGPGPHLSLTGLKDIFGMPIEKFDYFAEMILHEEIVRIGCPGFAEGLGSGMCIGLPPILQFGTDKIKEKVTKAIILGEKRVALAISEAFAGSDVANVKTRANLSSDGTHYIVNGTKKWITNGTQAHYITTLVRTENGLSLLLIERGDGVKTEIMKTSYSSSAGTAYITFENVKVPVENLIGVEGMGFMHTMYNFNHERWIICSYIISSSRDMIDECFRWANQRIVFGKKLIEQPVIRQKLASMIGKVESVYSWLESLTYQMNFMDYDCQSEKLGGTMSLLKVQATRTAFEISDAAVQIFGGRAVTGSGMGKLVERFMRCNKFAAILGGSEEIMADLGIRMAVKTIPSTSRL